MTATAEDLGKTPGKDARASKATYPAVYGIESTRERVAVVHRAAREAAQQIGRDPRLLISIADFIRDRQS